MPSRKPFVFLFTGDEFLSRGKIESLLDQLIPHSLRQTNLFRLYPEDINWPVLLNQAATPSLMGGAQVFWISGAGDIKKSDYSVFESYCLKPVAESYFIFEANELSASHPLMKLTVRFGKHFHTTRSEENSESWQAKLRQFNKSLTPDAWQALRERLSNSPRLIDVALDQLILYSEGSQITEKDVEEISSKFLCYEPFDLTKALLRKDISEALQIFHFFYRMSGDITSIVGLLHWQLKRIWHAKQILAHGGGKNEIGRILNIYPSQLAVFLSQIQEFNIQTVEWLLEKLWQTDWQTKTGASDHVTAVEVFLAGVA